MTQCFNLCRVTELEAFNHENLNFDVRVFNSLSSERILSIFDHATLKNYISAVIYSSISSYTSLERVKIKLLEKKIFRSQGTHNILHKKNKQGIFLDNYL